MGTVIVVFLLALTITGLSTPYVRRLALSLSFVDLPSQRKMHATPMPLMGGVAIFGGAIFVLGIYFARAGSWRIVGLLVAAAMIAVVGLIDDRRSLPPLLKFSGQALAFVVAIALGTVVQLPLPLPLNILLTFIWFGIITNAMNFLDNMDGLCAGIAAVASAFIVLMASFSKQFFIGPIAAATLGACVGFLRYNFKPARIFLGDAGSLLLGFLLAYMTLQLRFPANSTFVTWMIPIFIMGVPLFDLALVSTARLLRGVNPLTAAGKDHVSHRLVRMGYSQREAVLFLYLLGGIFGMIALFIMQASIIEGYVIGIVALLLALLGLTSLVQRERRRPPPGGRIS